MSNRLAGESSPYLQQHAGNPVDWYPWGEEAFARARELDRPVHLSIGYFACHWCHVMAHESFEDPQTAALLNAHFINVKVDRQERPDLDDIYQRVVQMMGQSGGWPLTVFLTPAQEPFYAGTYFPPEERHGRPAFPRLLRSLDMAWRTRRTEVRENSAQFLRGFQESDERLFAPLVPAAGAEPDLPWQAALSFGKGTDPVHGGLGAAPKFPNVSAYDLVLRVLARPVPSGHDGAVTPAADTAAKDRAPLAAALERTLEHMAAGGIRDHLGGGFARYSVDERWVVPHFEKMLYDNAQLVKLYADAYRWSGRPDWRAVCEDTLAYVLRDLAHPGGGYYASEDADSEGVEGRFYAWDPQELREALGEADGAFAAFAYGVAEVGNFEHGRSVLQRVQPLDAQQCARLVSIRERLRTARAQRVRPARDDNIITGWNGLMIQGLCAAYQATGTGTYLHAAREAADFLAAHCTQPDGGLYRAWRDGVAGVPGFLDDYAYLANGLLDLYESAFELHYLQRAQNLADHMLERFWDAGLYYTPRDTPALVHRPLSPFDNAWPSGLSEAVLALLRLHALTGVPLYGQRAHYVLDQFAAAAARNGFGFAHLLAAQEFARRGPASVLFAGDLADAAPLIAHVHRRYAPGRVLAAAPHVPAGQACAPVQGRPAAYVCRAQTCLPPAGTVAQLAERLAEPGA